MITVPNLLDSAVTGGRSTLNLLVIDNIGGTAARGDCRVRMYAKGSDHTTVAHWIRTKKPIREAKVMAHARKAEPVGNLIAKSLKALGYG